jgi:hypothetical protein
MRYEHRFEPLLPALSAAVRTTEPVPATVVGTTPVTLVSGAPEIRSVTLAVIVAPVCPSV